MENMHGFAVIREREMTDGDGILYEMVHRKTGAQLCWLKNEDENKTFAIAFKTIPQNDTGVFHILEHSVLNGSQKYPAREPFVELLKGSLQTFLNAFTYPDKTMYPVASRNEKDFMNLMSVYMDAVFHPSIYTNPNIFYQEGWHYEILQPEDEPVYKGVVLNEMKGAFSSVDETIVDNFNRMLFPDNCYRFVSGGDPEYITDLSYEEFIETHQKFYHPSNARVFLEGNMDIEAVLSFLDEEYFSHYEKEEMSFTIPMQKTTKGTHLEYAYEIAEGEDTRDRTQISFARIVSSFDNLEKNIAWDALSEVLVSSNESPLKKNILDKGLGQDVELEIYDSIQQPWAVLTVRNSNRECYDEICKTLRETVSALVQNGLDHDEIDAALNQMEFRYRERHEPAGVMHAQRAMEAWLYDGDPALYLNLGYIFDVLRRKLKEGYFEELVKEFFLEEEYLHSLVSIPSDTLGRERTEKEREKLRRNKAEWKEKVQEYITLNENLMQWQAIPDSEEVINMLPKLSLADIKQTVEDYPWKEKKIRGVPVLEYPQEKSGIVYMNYYFSLAGITRDKLPQVSTFASMLTDLATKNYSVQQLQARISKTIGALNFYTDSFSVKNDHNKCMPFLVASCSVLEKNVKEAIDLIVEILQNTIFDKEAILPLVKQDNEEFRQALIMNGHSMAMRRASAHFSAEGVFREFTSGFSASLFEKDLEANYDAMIESVINEFSMYQEVLFSPARLTFSITGEHDDLVTDMIDRLNYVDAQRAVVHYPFLEEKKECIIIPAGISYSAVVGNMEDKGYSYVSGMAVMSHMLTYDYLWSEVRVKGGAYGTGFSTNPNGNCGAYSYRDPSPLKSISIIEDASSYLVNAVKEMDNLDTFIIGTMSNAEPLLSPPTRIRLADSRYFREKTYEERLEAIREILSLKPQNLADYAEGINAALKDGAVCIIGPAEIVEQCEGFTILNSED